MKENLEWPHCFSALWEKGHGTTSSKKCTCYSLDLRAVVVAISTDALWVAPLVHDTAGNVDDKDQLDALPLTIISPLMSIYNHSCCNTYHSCCNIQIRQWHRRHKIHHLNVLALLFLL